MDKALAAKAYIRQQTRKAADYFKPTENVRVRDFVREVPGAVGQMFSGTKDTFVKGGKILGEGLAYATSPNVRKMYQAGNTNILPTVSNTTPRQMLGNTAKSAMEILPVSKIKGLATAAMSAKVAPRMIAGGAMGYGYDVADKMSRPEPISQSTFNPGIATLAGALMGGLSKPTAQMLGQTGREIGDDIRNLNPANRLSHRVVDKYDMEPVPGVFAPGGIQQQRPIMESFRKEVETTQMPFEPKSYLARVLMGKQSPVGNSIQAVDDNANKLLPVHNLSEQKLRFADRIDGLANPSMAVIDPKKTAFESYGDISLFPRKEMLVGEKTHLADAYSPRFPSVHSSLDWKAEQQLAKDMQPLYDEIGKDARKIYLSGSDDAVREIENNPSVALKFLKENGITPSKDGQHYYHGQIQKLGLDGKFQAFLDGMYKKYGLKENLFAGYTNSGQRRYKPLDVNEASKIMSKQKEEGFDYGIGSYRSKVAPVKRTLEGIRKESKRLVSKEAMDKVKDESWKKLESIQESLRKYANVYSDNQFSESDSQMSAIGSVLSGEKDAMSYFNAKFSNVPPKIMSEIYKFKDELKKMPTEYFETKFKRPVKLNEFAHALVKEGTADEAIKILKKHGLSVDVYKEGSKQKALEKLLKNNSIAFSLLAAVGLGGLNQSQEK